MTTPTPRGVKLRAFNNRAWRTMRNARRKVGVRGDRESELEAIEQHLATKGATKGEMVRRGYTEPYGPPQIQRSWRE